MRVFEDVQQGSGRRQIGDDRLDDLQGSAQRPVQAGQRPLLPVDPRGGAEGLHRLRQGHDGADRQRCPQARSCRPSEPPATAATTGCSTRPRSPGPVGRRGRRVSSSVRSSQRHPAVDHQHLSGRGTSPRRDRHRRRRRRRVCRCAATAPSSGLPHAPPPNVRSTGVSMSPRATAWTRISGPSTLASRSVRWLSAALDARVRDRGADRAHRRRSDVMLRIHCVARRSEARHGGTDRRSTSRSR